MRRNRFFFNLGALGTAVIMMLCAVAFRTDAAKWVGFGIGIGICAASVLFVAAGWHQRRFGGYPELRVFGLRAGVWSFLAGAIAGVAAWEIVVAVVFEAPVSRWITLGNGVVIAGLACAGLVVHEASCERVVHVLEIVERPPSDVA